MSRLGWISPYIREASPVAFPTESWYSDGVGEGIKGGRSLARRHFRSHHHQHFLQADWFSFFSRTGEVFLLCEPAASRLGTLLIFCRFGQLFVGLLLPVRFPQGVSRGVYLCHLLAQCALPLACLRALGRPCLLQSGFSPPVFGIS